MNFGRNIPPKKLLIITLVLVIQQFFIFFIQKSLPPVHYDPHNIFFLELVSIPKSIPSSLLFILNAGNLILIWLISIKISKGGLHFAAPLIYAISPWGAYLAISQSFYIYILFLILTSFLGLILMQANNKFGYILAISATILLAYSQIFFLIFPFLFILLAKLKVVNFNISRFSILIFALLVPLIFLIIANPSASKNILNYEVGIFSDPGLQNTVNVFQGSAKIAGFGPLAKLSENRYLYFSEFAFLKICKYFVPSTYFTSQEKLLNFSFSPPLYFGFLIPFAWGLWNLAKISLSRKILIFSSLLLIPAFLSKQLVDLNRLIIFYPILIFVTTYGLAQLGKHKKEKVAYLFLILAILLVIFQFLVTISDINLRENERFNRYLGQNLELGKQ